MKSLAKRGKLQAWRVVGAMACTALLVACAGTPGAAAPQRRMLTAEQLGAAAAKPEQLSELPPAWPRRDWWNAWGDSALSGLIELALLNQPSLQTVQARLQQAQAAVDVAAATRLPQVTGTLDLTDQRFTKNGVLPPPLAGSTFWNNNLQATATWELDLFGRQRAALDAAIGQHRALQADGQAAGVLLAARVATAYFDLARLNEAQTLARQALKQRQQVLGLVRQRIGAGFDTNVEKHQAEGLIAQIQVEIEVLEEAMARTRHALAELTGQGPQALASLAPQLAQITIVAMPQGLPADLLGRRADLVAQRWRVEATLKEVEVARAQFYPDVNLIAFFGLSSIGLDRFIEAGAQTYGIGPAIRLPLFDGGRLRANLSSRNAEVDAAIDAYNATLLHALREVADEVASLQSLDRQRRNQEEASRSAQAAFDLALQRYQAGLGNFLVVLSAETNVLAQRRAASDLKARRLTAAVALIRALGGGYDDDQPKIAAATSATRAPLSRQTPEPTEAEGPR